MQWIVFILPIVFYLIRFILKQRSEAEEAERRRRQAPPNPSTSATTATQNPAPEDKPQPKTIEEILKEMHRRVETQSKPYAKPLVQTPAHKKHMPQPEAIKPQPKVKEKKEPEPFLTEEYSAYKIEEAKIPANMAADFIKQGQLVDIYNQPKKIPSILKNFNLQDAVVAQIILERPEY